MSVQDRCTVCAECTIGSEISLNTPDGLLGDIDLVESHLGPFGDSVSVGVRLVHGLCQTYDRLWNHFGHI